MIRLFLAGIFACLIAISVATPANPARAEPIVFQTDMYGTENVPSVTTVAYGFVRFFFNDARTAADYTVDVKGYNGSQVTGADIHRGARGVNGPVVKHLADGGFIVTGGRASFSEQDLADMAAGLWYVSVKTVDLPDGALRGQIVLPAGFTPGSSGPAAGIPPLPGLPVASAPAVPPAPPPAVQAPPPAVVVQAEPERDSEPEAYLEPEPELVVSSQEPQAAPASAVPQSPPPRSPAVPAPSGSSQSTSAGIIRPPSTGSAGLVP